MAGVTIKHKRKAGAFANGELAEGELGLDITNGVVYCSSNGTTVFALPSTSAVTALIATAVTGLLDLKGATDCSANPNYPVALKGDIYVVTAAGKIGGAAGKSVDISDMYLATADNAGGTEASVGTSWVVLEHNLVGAYFVGGTDVAVADGGTGASTAAAARTNLGLGSVSTQNSGTALIQFLSNGLQIADLTGTKYLTFQWLEVPAASRTLFLDLDDANRTLNIAGDAVISGTNTGNETAATTGTLINSVAAKATPVDADMIGLMDSAAANTLKKLSWANLKATAKTYFDTLYEKVLTYVSNGVSSITLTAADRNSFFTLTAAFAAAYLPASGTMTAGDIFYIHSASVSGCSIYSNGSDVIRYAGVEAYGFSVEPYETVSLRFIGSGVWVVDQLPSTAVLNLLGTKIENGQELNLSLTSGDGGLLAMAGEAVFGFARARLKATTTSAALGDADGSGSGTKVVVDDDAKTINLQADNGVIVNGNPAPTSGLYTPTVTAEANVSSTTAYECQYTQVGDVVTVSGRFEFTPSSQPSVIVVAISLPVPAVFTSNEKLGGTGVSERVEAFSIRGDYDPIMPPSYAPRAQLVSTSTSTSSTEATFSFMYYCA